MRKAEYKRKKSKIAAAVFMVFLMIATMTGCKDTAGSDKKQKDGKQTEALAAVNQIPEDGIITKEQFQTIAGKDTKVQFEGKTEDGISYTWTYDASKIKNAEDQNLKIDFTKDQLEDIKTQANHANDALKLTMHGKGLISVPILTITLPEAWQSDTGLLLKEQSGKLARMSDVTIESQPEEKEKDNKKDTKKESSKGDATEGESTEKTNGVSPVKGQTILTMSVTSIDGACYVVGGITGTQNKGAGAANTKGKNAAGSAENQNTGSSSAGQTSPNGDTNSGGDKANTDGNVSDDNDASDVKTEGGAKTCTISISCATILDNMDHLTDGKEEFVPADGWILAPSTVEFEEGESVHDVLKRVCKDAGIHMESNYTPAYNSAYVEGINQLYEFDCGELSGWMYKVNGWFPNYGCSKYTVSDGDEIDWIYTCDLGKDVGDNSMY